MGSNGSSEFPRISVWKGVVSLRGEEAEQVPHAGGAGANNSVADRSTLRWKVQALSRISFPSPS